MDVATILPTIKYLSRKFPDCLETFQTVRKLSILSGNFPYCQENFQTIWKLSGPTGNFPVRLETFQSVWKLCGPSDRFPDCPETFQTVWKLSTFVYSSVQLMLRLHFMGYFCKYAQKLFVRAKTFRLAMPPRQRGFWDSAVMTCSLIIL